ncbi:MAG: hypothetical protein ACOX3G_00110 [Armatimonadota bacterium]|jgi:hypothetical protein
MANIIPPHAAVQFIDYAIESAIDGQTRAYLLSAAKGEKVMRDECLELKANAVGADSSINAYSSLRSVNGFYRTRYSLALIQDMAQIAFDSVQFEGWWSNDPPDILQCSDAEAASIAAFIPRTLQHMSKSGLHHPYSLLTKWMHFCFPDSFVIYDWQVALSVQTWSYFTFALEDSSSEHFAANNIAQLDGSGYRNLLDFYRFCWESAASQQRDALQAVAKDLGAAISSHVSIIDVIDKALWKANGDPRKMGLLTRSGPPQPKQPV